MTYVIGYIVLGVIIGYFAYTQMSEKIEQTARIYKSIDMGLGWPFVVLLIVALLVEDFCNWLFGVEFLDDDEDE